MLFDIFINSISDRIKESGEYLTIAQLLYADDIVLMASSADDLQALIDIFYQEATKWKLKLNIAKTKVMIIRSDKEEEKYKWKIEGQNVEIVESYVYLGFEITSDLKIKKLRESLLLKAKRAQALAFGICSTSKNLSTATCMVIWKQLISPHLEFAAGICERKK